MDGGTSSSRNWICLGKRIPRNELTYIVQSFVLVVVIIISLINLSLGTGVHDLNISLLSSSLGAFLPGPRLTGFKDKMIHTNEDTDTVDSNTTHKTT